MLHFYISIIVSVNAIMLLLTKEQNLLSLVSNRTPFLLLKKYTFLIIQKKCNNRAISSSLSIFGFLNQLIVIPSNVHPILCGNRVWSAGASSFCL